MTEDQFRIEVFGAIRRAAAIARRNDRDAESWAGFSVEDELRGIAVAASVRRAIRVAIGSAKV